MRERASGRNATLIAVFAIATNSIFFIFGEYGPQLSLSFPGLGFSIGSKFVLSLAAPFFFAGLVLLSSHDARKSLCSLGKSWTTYFIAGTLGICLPFVGYLGSHSLLPSAGYIVTVLLRLIAVNFLISPLWEEIIWRGYVLGAFRTEMSELRAVFFSCGLWTLWHFGLLVAQVHEGLPLVIICLLPVQYFCVGVFLCWLYKSSEGALYPCVLFHGTLNAAKVAYYTSGYNRTVEVGSYVSETVGMLILMVVSVYLLGKVVAPGDVASSEGSKGL